jgi:hypothetical protein
MSGNTEGRAGTTTSSTDSGQGSDPLSDAFIVVAAGGKSSQNPDRRVEAPVGSAQFHIRRSSRVASSRSRSMQASASLPPVMEIVDTLPGRKRKLGYAYEILQPTSEEAGPSVRSVVPTGNVDGPRDIATPQRGSTNGTGRKRSATSAAPESAGRGPVSKRLASAADFSPTHFDEPASDGPIPAQNSLQRSHIPSPHQRSPTMFEPEVPVHIGKSQPIGTPFSSPISQNPLLRKEVPMVIQTPSPSQRRPLPFRTQDSNAAWEAAEGLRPIQEGFTAPGYVPAGLVGGISYIVRSPRAQSREPNAQRASMGRQLFAEYAGTGIRSIPQQRSAVQGVDLQQQLASQGHQQQQQRPASRDVRLRTSLIYAHILTNTL